MARFAALPDVRIFTFFVVAVERISPDAVCVQRVHLVFHQ